uniref:Uncharacterized protein n=1 Tax=Pseudo-nitzschia delicatissima TaxID=44447 RepID=A0A7S0Y752_9STRA|mmetsp:Transcript_1507/g.3138  ORF Transcript_1507/g.3138 Transcript_1507/m.3138 type:complete len:264 (+) Transcript_1507:88-879(+)
MKFSVASLFLLAGYASAGKPELSITLSDGSYGDLKSAVSPIVSLSGEGGGIEYGATVDLASDGMPKSVWGVKSASSGGWNLKTRAEFTQGKYNFAGDDSGAYVTLEANDDAKETFLWSSATISKGDGIRSLKAGAKKIVDTDAGKFMIAPRHNFETSSTEVVLGYEKDDTDVYLTINDDAKDILVKQTIDDTYSATLKAGPSGFLAASVTSETDLGSTKLTLTPDDIDVEIKNDGWVAGISCDKNLASAEPTVRFSKSLTFGI